MIDAVARKLKYIDPPKYKSHNAYREYLRKSANYSCAYCTISESESPGSTFNIDHFRPKTLFPDLSSECSNLRYSCPRCNSYKGDLWISPVAGCLRNCSECENHICKANTDRFIDPLDEDPADTIYLGEDDKIYAYPKSKPANYTIQYLRLNRAQLIKLRHIRRFMDSWIKDLEERHSSATEYLESAKQKQLEFSKSSCSQVFEKKRKDNTYREAISTMYEMLVIQAEQSVLLIEEEMRRVNYLISQRSGCDDLISKCEDA